MTVRKLEVFIAVLATGKSVFVHFVPHPDDVLPTWLYEERAVCLQFGLNLATPIPDLSFDEEGVSATLSFQGKTSFCSVSWSRVFLIADGNDDDARGAFYPDVAPAELREAAKAREEPPTTPARPALRLVKGGKA